MTESILRQSADLSTNTPDLQQSVRARAPLRLGLAGGGTDLAAYCDEYGGAVLNLTIDRYAHAFVGPARDGVNIVAADIEVAERFTEQDGLANSRLKLHRAVHERFMQDVLGGKWFDLSVTTSVDSPPGSGLGSSSALVVALVEAYRSYFNLPLGPYELAQLAFDIERVDLGMAGGKQDQYAAAFGGVNFIEFLTSGSVLVNPLRVPATVLDELETSLVICFSGQSRDSSKIIEAQQRGILSADNDAISALHEMKSDAAQMKSALLSGQLDLMAEILNRSWIAKKRTAGGIATSAMGELEDAGNAAGARACKVSGAGGGGFIMFMVAPERRQSLIQALNAKGARASSVKFTHNGVESWRRLANSL